MSFFQVVSHFPPQQILLLHSSPFLLLGSPMALFPTGGCLRGGMREGHLEPAGEAVHRGATLKPSPSPSALFADVEPNVRLSTCRRNHLNE